MHKSKLYSLFADLKQLSLAGNVIISFPLLEKQNLKLKQGKDLDDCEQLHNIDNIQFGLHHNSV